MEPEASDVVFVAVVVDVGVLVPKPFRKHVPRRRLLVAFSKKFRNNASNHPINKVF